MKSKATLVEIARKAGVSIATVSRILNDTGRVSPATRQKVLQAIRELEFDTAMTGSETIFQTILVLVPDFVNPFYAAIIDGIQQTAHDNHFEIFLVQTKDVYPNPSYYLNLFRRGNFSGVLWLSSTPPSELLSVLEHQCPIVMCCEYPEDHSCSYVSIDDVTAAYRAVKFLISTGCEKIGSKKDSYAKAKVMMEKFAEKNSSVICKELKGLTGGPVLRTCDGCIEDAARLVAEYLTAQN